MCFVLFLFVAYFGWNFNAIAAAAAAASEEEEVEEEEEGGGCCCCSEVSVYGCSCCSGYWIMSSDWFNFHIQLAFLPYCPYIITIQLGFLP